MTVGDNAYQLSLSRIAFSFKGSISMEYLQNAGLNRVQELSGHLKTLAEELENSG